MIKITDKSKCCGCSACINICPKNCITMKLDNEGFEYPAIDLDKCIDCKLCEKVCHLNSDKKLRDDYLNEFEYYAAYNKDKSIARKSSSGGIFWMLAQEIIENKGIVYGVKQTSTYSICHERAENLEQCEKFLGSKYLQSDIGFTLKEVKADLEEGKKVLFTGTPCQVAGLYSFLGKEYKNLFTCDVVCHGVPSKRVFKEYISEVESEYNKQVINVKWRDKVKGWNPNRVTLYFEDGTSITSPSQDNKFQRGFLDNTYLRNSCYECKYAKIPRIADISLADFWGYQGELKKENDNAGLSIIVVSTLKGKRLFENIKRNLKYHIVSEEYVKSKSRHVYIHPKVNHDRERFFRQLDEKSFSELYEKYISNKTKLKKIKRKIRHTFDEVADKLRGED